MATLEPEKNALYQKAADLHRHHWETLGARGPAQAASETGAALVDGALLVPVLGRVLRVGPEDRTVRFHDDPGREVGYQRALVAVAYLGTGQDLPPRGDWVTLRELSGGDAFFRGPHSPATARLEAAFGSRPHTLVPAAALLGGRPVTGADTAVELPALPRVALRVLLWQASDEFGASASVLVDARAPFHLALDVLWALSNLAIHDLTAAAGNKSLVPERR